MKKENRKMAQQRRAQERRKKERIRKIRKFLTIVVPCLAVILLVAAITLSSRSSGDTSSAENTSSTDTADTNGNETGSTTYSTETSLTVESGDTVNIDYVGTVDGVEFEGGSTDGLGTDLVIGSGSYIDGFEDQLIGAHPGDTVEVNVTFPEDYGVEDLNGKAAVFTVTVNGIYE